MAPKLFLEMVNINKLSNPKMRSSSSDYNSIIDIAVVISFFTDSLYMYKTPTFLSHVATEMSICQHESVVIIKRFY